VEWAHAVAPKATIDLALAKSNDDADLARALRYVAARGLGNVVSQSYGGAERCSGVPLAAQHRTFADMESHGTTVLASSGDQGAAQHSCDGTSWVKSARTPASDPLVTGV
jgi:subtilase family serine protease